MKKFLPALIALLLLSSCSLFFGKKAQAIEERGYLFTFYDGTKLAGDFQGAQGRAFYILADGKLYKVRRNAIKTVRDNQGKNVTKMMVNFDNLLDIQWQYVNEFVDFYNRDKEWSEPDLPYPYQPQTVLNQYNQIELRWRLGGLTSRSRKRHFLGTRIDKRYGAEPWQLGAGKTTGEDTLWVDTDVPQNQIIFYRLCALHDQEDLSAEEQILSYSETVSGIWWDDNFAQAGAGSFVIGPAAITAEPSKQPMESEPTPDATVKTTGVVANIALPFAISKTEITNGQYCAMLNFALPRNYLTGDFANNKTLQNSQGDQHELLDLDDTQCRIYYDQNLDRFAPVKGFAEHPVTELTWFGAAFYCNVFSEYAGQFAPVQPLYNLDTWELTSTTTEGYRLPTELEWEYATRYPGNLSYPWGDAPADSLANVASTSTVPVETFANGTGQLKMFDQLGNVAEWCHESFSSRPKAELAQALAPQLANWKIVKGGSWQEQLKPAWYRQRLSPDSSLDTVGFRPLHVFALPVAQPQAELPIVTIPTSKRKIYQLEDLKYKRFSQ